MQIQNPVLTGSLTLNGLNITTGNLVTTGSNVFVGNQTITGSVNITGSLITTGSISLERGSLRIGDGAGGFSGFTFSSTLRQTNNNPVTLLGALRVDSTAGNTSYISGSGGLAIGKGTATSYLDISGSTLITGSLGVTGPITGSSILSTGQITAQTLVVSTISSSVTFSSGSNIFGNSTANTQTMTGSVNITGSLTITTAGTSPEFQVVTGGTIKGNALTDVHQVTGSLRVTGSTATFAGDLTAKTLGTNDLILNNLNYECANYVDGTRGSWLIQEGACDLFIINQVSGKKYKFNLIEIK